MLEKSEESDLKAVPAEGLVPQQAPMRFVDSLVDCCEGGGTAEFLVGEECILLDDEGRLDSLALVEAMAQAYAAVKGQEERTEGKGSPPGLLVGFSDVDLSGEVRIGDRLRVTVKAVGSFEHFTIAEGEVRSRGSIVASASLRVWTA